MNLKSVSCSNFPILKSEIDASYWILKKKKKLFHIKAF